MKIVKPLKYKQTELSFEKTTDKVSMTIPDQAYTLKELIEASRRILPPEELFLGDDLEANRLADLPKMDLTDQMDVLHGQRQKVKDLKEKASDEAKAKQKEYAENLESLIQFKKDKDAEAAKSKNPGGSPDQT